MAGVREEKLGAVIDRFYEAAVQPDLWRTALNEIGPAVGAEGAALVPHAIPGLTPANSESLDELVDTFVREAWHLNNPRERFFRRPSQDMVTESELFTPEELDRLPFNADLIGRLGFRWFAGAIVMRADQGVISLTMERKVHQEPFSRRELSAIGATLPHLRRALQLSQKVSATRYEGMLDALEALGCGGVLLDALGSVIRLNTKAQRHVGAGIQVTHGQLAAEHRSTNAALQRLIGSVLQPGPAHEALALGAVALPRPGQRPLIVHAAPIVGSARDVFQRAKAILMLVDPDEHREPAEPILRQAFGLTPVEVQLALGLARGQDLQEIAEARGVSIGTVRFQLKGVFAKTETHRQAELVALLTRMAAIPPKS